MNGRGQVRPCRWQNLSPLTDLGTQGDVMDVAWCDQVDIMESIAARGHPRGCYGRDLVQPRRYYGIYRRSGAPKGMLCAWALV